MVKKRQCNFCNAKEGINNPFISGDDIYICSNCVVAAYQILFENEYEKDTKDKDIDLYYKKEILLTPKEIHLKLDKYVIGQDKAKKILSVAVYNHYKRIFKINKTNSKIEIDKSNIILIGPTGSGKTLLAQTIARFLDVPIAITDATNLTEAGYVGEDVENILTKLMQSADGDIRKAERGIIFIDEIDKIARMGENRSITRDVSGEGVQQALLKIIEGSVVNIPPKGGRKHPNQDFIQINTSNILFICGGAFDGMENIIEKKLGKNQMGFKKDTDKNENIKNLSELIEPDDLVQFGIIPELVGRLHIIATLEKLTLDNMVQILIEPKNAIIKQYKELFKIDGVKLIFDKNAINFIAQQAIESKTGARGLRSILEKILMNIMYNLPELKKKSIKITKELIENILEEKSKIA